MSIPLPVLPMLPHPRTNAPERFIEERLEGADEAFLVPILDGHLYYSPLANVSMLLDDFGASTLRRYLRKEPLIPAEQTLIDSLTRQGVFRAPKATREAPAQPGASWAPTSATFSNTQKCTLRCTYCYAEGGRLEDLDLPVPVAKAAVDVIVTNARAQGVNPSISFLGEGEATASWSVFHEIIDYFKEQCRLAGFTPTISLSTNGVFSPARLEYIAENCTHLTISLDGVRSVNNEHRVLPNGGGSFDRVVATMKGLDARWKPYDIRSTVTVAGTSRLTEFVLFVGQNLQCKSIHLEPVFDVMGITGGTGGIESPSAQKFVDHFRQARQVAAGFGIELYYSGAAMKQRETFCGASDARNFLITARGIVTSCNEVLQTTDPRAHLFHYGEWSQAAGEFVLDQAAIRRLRKLNVHDIPKCQGCIAKYNCAGDCYAKSASVAPGGDPAAAGYTERCHITRELLKDNLLISLISNLVGAGRDRPDEAPCRL